MKHQTFDFDVLGFFLYRSGPTYFTQTSAVHPAHGPTLEVKVSVNEPYSLHWVLGWAGGRAGERVLQIAHEARHSTSATKALIHPETERCDSAQASEFVRHFAPPRGSAPKHRLKWVRLCEGSPNLLADPATSVAWYTVESPGVGSFEREQQ